MIKYTCQYLKDLKCLYRERGAPKLLSIFDIPFYCLMSNFLKYGPNEEVVKKSDYWKKALLSLEDSGNWRGKTTEKEIMEDTLKTYDMYLDIRAHGLKELPTVYLYKTNYIVHDGHHRIVILDMLNYVKHWFYFLDCTPIERLVLEINRGKREIYQPIPVVGFKDFIILRKCYDRNEMIIKAIGGQIGTMLDIGCNLGYFTRSFTKLGYKVKGIDTDAKYIELCAKIELFDYTNAEYKVLDFMKENGSFDTVLCLSVIHHIYKKNKDLYFKALVQLFNLTNNQLIIESGTSSEKYLNSYTHLTPDNLMEDLRKVGFKKFKILGESENNRQLIMAIKE